MQLHGATTLQLHTSKDATLNWVSLGAGQPQHGDVNRTAPTFISGKADVGASVKGCLYPSTLQIQRRRTSKDADPGTQPTVKAPF